MLLSFFTSVIFLWEHLPVLLSLFVRNGLSIIHCFRCLQCLCVVTPQFNQMLIILLNKVASHVALGRRAKILRQTQLYFKGQTPNNL